MRRALRLLLPALLVWGLACGIKGAPRPPSAAPPPPASGTPDAGTPTP
ncbi:MAG TPA: hypothetical protein VK447_02275 [Myxococcaceae bacterium]|nr:hypothetical protein [Myxococcaceae bacterium]